MKLYYAATSPFVRKCLVCAHELKVRERLELLTASAHPVNRDPKLVAANPLGQVPTLVLDDDSVLYDSRVICEYLNESVAGPLLPPPGAARWSVLVEQALADGILDAAVLTRYETFARPEALRWSDWAAGQLDKVSCGLAEFERRAPHFGGRVDLGTIALGCALGYLDFRYSSYGWRDRHPATAAWFARFEERESMRSTAPPAA